MALIRLTFLALACASPLLAGPFIGPRAIFNAASYAPFGTPGGGLARGAVISIFGTGLGPASSPPLAFPLATTLGGVSIKVNSPDGSTSVSAIPLYVSANQINAILPSSAPLGMASLVVNFNGANSNPSPIQVVNAAFGIYSISSAGSGPGILQNFNSAADQPINSLTIAAQPGQAITLWGTGLGPVAYADNIAPTPGSLPTPVEVFVGGVPASVLYSGRSPCCSGTDQVVFTVPAGAPSGCWVPVQVRTETVTVSNTVTMAIGPSSGSACSEPANPFATKFAGGGNLGWVNLFRLAVRRTYFTLTIDTTADYLSSTFRNEPGGAFAFNPLYSLPPLGACTTYSGTGNLFGNDPLAGTAGIAPLDAGGALTVAGKRQPQPKSPTVAYAQLGYLQAGIVKMPSTLVLNPGNVGVQGPGGADVGSFLFNIQAPTPLTWTNRDQLPKTIPRTQPLTVNFSGVPAGHTVLIMGGYYSRAYNATGMFTCTADPSAGSFTVPAYILSNVPALTLMEHTSGAGVLMVGSTPLGNPLTFSASGLDYGAAFLTVMNGKAVRYQ